MKKVINVEPGEVFKMLAAGKDVYTIDTSEDNLINMRYQPVYVIFNMIKADDRAFFIVEEADT